MNWDERLQDIVDYVEEHLQRFQEPVEEKRIAYMAGCSYSFFLKVFSYMNGISFSEYIRSRKMTLAGYDLKSTNLKIVELSLKYGYDSPTSFTRAFQQFHGCTPQKARRDNIKLRVSPKLNISRKQEYAWRVEQKPAFRLVGKKIKLSTASDQHYQRIPAFWNECQRDGTFAELISMDEGNTHGLMGLFGKCDERTQEMEYAIMVVSSKPLPKGFAELVVAESNWAVFDCIGAVPQAIQECWKILNEEWLVKYPFRHGNGPEIEWYSNGNLFAEDYFSQIWIPIIEEE